MFPISIYRVPYSSRFHFYVIVKRTKICAIFVMDGSTRRGRLTRNPEHITNALDRYYKHLAAGDKPVAMFQTLDEAMRFRPYYRSERLAKT